MTVGAMGLTSSAALSEEANVKIVGIGATSCAEFLRESEAKPVVQRDYLAWAQGFMSAILLSRPAGVDEKLDLMPPALPLLEQLKFLHELCARHPENTFSETVEALYKHLRQLSKGERSNEAPVK